MCTHAYMPYKSYHFKKYHLYTNLKQPTSYSAENGNIISNITVRQGWGGDDFLMTTAMYAWTKQNRYHLFEITLATIYR